MLTIPEFHLVTTPAPEPGHCEIIARSVDGSGAVPPAFISPADIRLLHEGFSNGTLRYMSFDEHPKKIACVILPTLGQPAIIEFTSVAENDGFPPMSGWKTGGHEYLLRTPPIVDTGRMGEVLVELALLRRGWHVSRLDSTKFAANGDLIAVKGDKMHIVQVKATKERSVYMGSVSPFLKDEKPFFNRVLSPIQATALIAVSDCLDQPQYFVFLIGEAEKLAQSEVSAYHQKLVAMGKSYEKGHCKIPALSPALNRHRENWGCLLG